MSWANANESKKITKTVDTAKVSFHYTKVDRNKKASYYTLFVYMGVANGKPTFSSESINAAEVGWSDHYQLYQELACPEYSYAYLCVPSISLAIPINTFQSTYRWSHHAMSYVNKGTQNMTQLGNFGKVFVIEAIQNDSNSLAYRYYFSLKKGLVAFSVGKSNNLWVLSQQHSFGVGALSVGKSLNTNALSTADIKHYAIVKMSKN